MNANSKFFRSSFALGGVLCILALIMTLWDAPTPGYAIDPNYALRFSGNKDYVRTINKESAIYGNTNWIHTKSISVWVKPLGTSPACEGSSVAGCKLIVGDRPRFWGIYRGVFDGIDRIWVWNYDGSPDSAFDYIPIVYTPGEWIHITLVHADGLLHAYRYGFLAGSRVSGNSIGENSAPADSNIYIHIGGGITPPDKIFVFQGDIDEVRIYNRPLSGVEIREDLYRELNAPFETALRAYYKMSNGPPSLIVSDDSGKGNTAELKDGFPPEVPPAGIYPEWVTSDVFGGGINTPTIPATFTVTATFTLTPTATRTPTRTLTPTPFPPGFTPSVTPTRTATLNPNFTNFLFIPLVSK